MFPEIESADVLRGAFVQPDGGGCEALLGPCHEVQLQNMEALVRKNTQHIAFPSGAIAQRDAFEGGVGEDREIGVDDHCEARRGNTVILGEEPQHVRERVANLHLPLRGQVIGKLEHRPPRSRPPPARIGGQVQQERVPPVEFPQIVGGVACVADVSIEALCLRVPAGRAQQGAAKPCRDLAERCAVAARPTREVSALVQGQQHPFGSHGARLLEWLVPVDEQPHPVPVLSRERPRALAFRVAQV